MPRGQLAAKFPAEHPLSRDGGCFALVARDRPAPTLSQSAYEGSVSIRWRGPERLPT
jgi:hypothetical protein